MTFIRKFTYMAKTNEWAKIQDRVKTPLFIFIFSQIIQGNFTFNELYVMR